MKSYLPLTARILGIYAAFLAFLHGVFEIQQGIIATSDISMNAIGNNCIPDQIWHACFPAMTIWPNYLMAGIITVFLSVALLIFVLGFFHKPYSGWILIGFAISILLSGGGFIPTFTAIMAGIAIFLKKAQSETLYQKQQTFKMIWFVFISMYMLWAAGGWLFGKYFNAFMVENSFVLFFAMDLFAPMVSIIFARKLDYGKTSKLP